VTGVEKIKVINPSNDTFNKVYINVPLNAFSENASVQPVFDEFLDKAYPNGKDYGYMNFNNIYVDGEAVNYNLNETVLCIDLPEPLPPGESTEIRLELEAKIPVMNNRTGSDGSNMWFGNFIPLLAVHDTEGWHTDPYYPVGDPFFARASNFDVTVTTPAGYTAAGPGIPVVTDNDDKVSTEFTLKLARDFAFSLSRDYSSSTLTTSSNIEISLYTFSDNVRDQATDTESDQATDTASSQVTNTARAQEILSLASRSLEYYSNLLGAYPYSQLVITETRLFNKGGMSYPGVIFIDSDYMSAPDDDFASITHAIGNQWFYNIIGSNQIENAWMDEGLDSFVQEGFMLDGTELDIKMEDAYDSLKHTISQITPNTLHSSLGEFKSWSDYNSIQNIRAELMFYSLYKKIGKEAFNSFLVEYNRRYSFRIASPGDLIQTAEDISGMNLSAFFDAWINNPELPPLT